LKFSRLQDPRLKVVYYIRTISFIENWALEDKSKNIAAVAVNAGD
jgi:hypothetical protein